MFQPRFHGKCFFPMATFFIDTMKRDIVLFSFSYRTKYCLRVTKRLYFKSIRQLRALKLSHFDYMSNLANTGDI